MKAFLIQQTYTFTHQKRLMLNQIPLVKIYALIIILSALFLSGCKNPFSPKSKQKVATLLEVENASQDDLIKQVDYFAKVNSLRAKMDMKFIDNSYASSGLSERYKKVPGEIVVERPDKIRLKVEVPIIKSDIVQMTSDGSKFRVAILEDGAGGKYKKFIIGTNSVNYDLLQEKVDEIGNGDAKELKQNVNAFSKLRPQHFTDAMLVRPTNTAKFVYLVSTFTQEEVDFDLLKKKSPLGWVLRGYYLLDEFENKEDGKLVLKRRFWFDRVGNVRLARQQIYDDKGEIESDIIYGLEGQFTQNGQYRLPQQVILTRPKEKYKMRLKYQSPKSVSIGKDYPDRAFVLENRWNLEVVNLDEKLAEIKNQKNSTGESPKTQAGNDN